MTSHIDFILDLEKRTIYKHYNIVERHVLKLFFIFMKKVYVLQQSNSVWKDYNIDNKKKEKIYIYIYKYL
jgi:hypothetical protein